MSTAAAVTPAPTGATAGVPSYSRTETDGRRYVTPEKLAADISRIFSITVTVSTLAKWRCRGRGPAFVKLGRSVRYDVHDVEAWVEERRRRQADEEGE